MRLRRPKDERQRGATGPQPTPDAELGRFQMVVKVLRREYDGFGWQILIATALTAIAAIIELVIIFLIAGIGTAVTQHEKHFTLQLGIVLTNRNAALATIAAVLVRAVFDLIATKYKYGYMKRYELEARKSLLHDFLEAEWYVQSADDSGNVQTITVTYLRQSASSLSTLQDALTTFVASGWFLVGSVIAEGYKLLAMLAVGALLAWVLRPLIERSHSAGKDFRTSQLMFSRLAMEMYDMAREIRLFRANDHVDGKISATSEEVAEANRKNNVAVGVLSSLQATAVYLVGAVGLLAIVLLAVKNPEPLVVVVLLVYRGLGNLKIFQSDYQSLVNSLPSMVEMQENREKWREGSIPRDGVEYVPPLDRIEFDHVSFSYPGGNVALSDASFTIERGEALGLVGPSGSGKSTIVQLLLRLRLPSSGQIRVNGVDIAELRPGSWFGHAVLVPQEAQLFSATVLENVTSFRSDISRAGAEDALRRAHVLDEILALPDGLDTMLGDTGRALSGGQQQRVCIARALAAQPDVLILDEPTSGLDPISEEGIRATLQSLKGEVTIVIIAHRFTTLRVCETVMALEKGHIAAHGNREQLEAEGGYYAEAVRLSKLI